MVTSLSLLKCVCCSWVHFNRSGIYSFGGYTLKASVIDAA
uniref:Uncharacterized protein n=1 Tax=Arundo donax TaxID=35708 RepID=A0A0A8Z625_ARUDO